MRPVPPKPNGGPRPGQGQTGSGWSELRRPDRPRASSRGFSELAVTHCLAVAGDTFVTMALAGSVFFSISPQAARGRVALFLALTMAPFAVVAPILGPALDRSRGGRRVMVILVGASRALLCLSMARHLGGLLLFPEAFAALVLSKAHMVAKSSLVPSTVADDHALVEANSRLAVLAVVVGFVAAVPGVVVLKVPFLGAPWLMILASCCFAASAVSALRIHRPQEGASPLRLEEGEAELHTAAVRLSASAMAVLRAVVGFLTFLVAFTFRRSGAPAWWFGVAVAVSLVGNFAGNAVAPWLRRRTYEERILAGSLVVVAVAGFLCARASGRPSVAVLASMVGVSAGAGKLAFDSIVQRDAPDAVRGRTFARFETRFQLTWVAGAFLPVVFPIGATMGMDLIALAGATSFVIYVGGLVALRGRQGPGSVGQVDPGQPQPGGSQLGRGR